MWFFNTANWNSLTSALTSRFCRRFFFSFLIRDIYTVIWRSRLLNLKILCYHMFPAVVVYRSRLSLSFLSSSTFYFHFYTFHFISLCFLSSALLSSLATFLSYRLVYSVIFFLRYSLFLFRVTTACISVLSHRCSKRMRSWSIINVLSAPFSVLNFGNAHRRGALHV